MQQPGLNNRVAISRARGWLHLLAALAVVVLVWLYLLPTIGRQEEVRRYIDRNERLGIDPSAKFYTELPAMHDWHEHVQSARRRSDAGR